MKRLLVGLVTLSYLTSAMADCSIAYEQKAMFLTHKMGRFLLS
jgi:hypothetical protein